MCWALAVLASWGSQDLEEELGDLQEGPEDRGDQEDRVVQEGQEDLEDLAFLVRRILGQEEA